MALIQGSHAYAKRVAIRLCYEAIFHSPPGWEKSFRDATPGIKAACKIIEDLANFTTPDSDLCYRNYRLMPSPNTILVWMVAMDPYYTAGVANGVPFSCNLKQPSITNIFKELARTHPGFSIPDHGRLEEWFDRGVFMSNMAPLAKIGASGVYVSGWIDLVRTTAETILNHNRNVIIVLLGKDASLVKKIIGSDKGHIIEVGHPSPANRSKPFVGSNCFHKIDLLLAEYGKPSIDWNITPYWTEELEQRYSAPCPIAGCEIVESQDLQPKDEDFGVDIPSGYW